jgi:xylose isomerase
MDLKLVYKIFTVFPAEASTTKKIRVQSCYVTARLFYYAHSTTIIIQHKIKEGVLYWEDMAGDSRDMFGGITLQSSVQRGWFVEKKI